MFTAISAAGAAAVLLCATGSLGASIVAINGLSYDLDQFDGASVTYRANGSVDFDGKRWDQAAGVDGFTLGELASGQAGGDPGDQVTLQDRSTPDWLRLNYATPFQLVSTDNKLVIHEISSQTFVDPEGLSFNISINGGSLISATAATATNYNAGIGSDGPAENTNQLIFDLFSLGFQIGDTISTVHIENTDSGSGTSDPDFIFAAFTVPAPATVGLLAMAGITTVHRRR